MNIELNEEERRYLLKLIKREEQKATQKVTGVKLLEKIFGLVNKLSNSA